MANSPPPLPVPGAVPESERNLKFAATLNWILPGAGLFHLGRPIAGAVLAGTFLLSFLSVVVLFLIGYARYLSIAMSDDLLQGDKLEQAGAAFHQPWLIGLAVIGGVIYLISSILFARVKRQVQQAAKASSC